MSLRVKLGWAATVLWTLLWGFLLKLKWSDAASMTFNEWGDFFAGVSAPLAFLWLVIGYFQQGEELGQNTKALEQQEEALRLQVKELRQSVEQQKEMVKVTQQDLEINRANTERQYQKEKLLSQPVIRYRGVNSNTYQDQVQQSLKLLNIGHLINRVELEVINPPSGLELRNEFLDNWDYNSEKQLHFVHPRGKSYSRTDRFTLELKYLDGLNEESSQTLYFSFNQSGVIVFSSERAKA